MSINKQKSRLKFTKTISSTPMTVAEWEASEDLLARMVARAITAEHPEMFGEIEE